MNCLQGKQGGVRMKMKSQLGIYYCGCISIGGRARPAAPGESKEGEIRDLSLSLCQ